MICDNVVFALGGTAVNIVDQRQLPGREVRIEVTTPQECREAIETLAVRGAPAIGIFAAFAFTVLALDPPASVKAIGGQVFEKGDSAENAAHFWEQATDESFVANMQQVADYLAASRPTAVNLQWALDRMMDVARAQVGIPLFEMQEALRAEALAIQQEDAANCLAMAELGLSLIEDGDGVITHCNAGPLATSAYGTSLGPLLLAKERDMNVHVFADETRPLLQGARLTTYELTKAGVETTLICDNMASIVMSQGRVQACFVGCDRAAANGDVANKIGTSGLAIIAAHYGVPFYVMCPTSSIDYDCVTGADIPIEERDPEEIKRMFFTEPVAPDTVHCYNPAFDVTDHSLITAIVTERGICRAPYTESLEAIRKEH